MYVKCTYNGVQLSETEFPKKWLTDGIQIKILFPFRLKPWHRSNLESSEKEKKNPMKKKNFCFLTIWGGEVELPFSGYPRDRLSFFYPILKELKRKTKNLKNDFFLVLNERTKLFLNVSKAITKWMIKNICKSILVINEKRKQLLNYLFILKFKKKKESIESKKDSTITKNNPLIYESPMPIQSIHWTNCSLTEKKIKDLNVKTKTIIKQIGKITKEKKGELKISEININSKKTTFGIKRLELEKNLLHILQRINHRLTRKSYSFFKFFVERVYIDIFVCIISIPRINVQLFSKSTKEILNKSIYNNESNTERTDKTNQNIIDFLSIIHKSYNTRSTNSQNSCDVSSLSQAYVFYKLSQTKILNVYKCKLRSVFEYHGKSFFLKNEIRDSFFGARGIFHSKLRHKNPPDSVINQWVNWLIGNYQYDLSHIRWSRLVTQKWRGKINENNMAQKKYFAKFDSYEKTRPILYKKQQVDSLPLNKKNGYDFLSYKSINYADKKDSYISGYRSTFQTNKKQAFSYNYNTHKQKLFDTMGNISIKNYIEEYAIIEMEKNMTRKSFDWMEMNVEILNRSRSNMEFCFFSKFFIFLNAYLRNPWIIPIKILFFHCNENTNVIEKKKMNGKKNKIDIFRPSKKKKSLSFESVTRNRSKAEDEGRIDIESPLSNQETDIEEYYVTSNGKGEKGTKKKRYKNKKEAELNFLLRKYLGFHLKWGGSLTQRILNNVKIYCLIIRLISLKEIAIASIQRGDLSLDIMVIQSHKDLTLKGLKKTKDLMKKRILIIEPVRLSRKNNEQFFMYQTTGFSLINKSKDQIHERYSEKGRVDKKNCEKYIRRTRDQKITENKEKNTYDLFVPENILSTRRRREFRILICFNTRNLNNTHRNIIFYNENKVNNFCQVLIKNKDLDRYKKKLMNLKLFLWPNSRLEDLACINRYWFDTHNGSRFSIVKICMYPRFKIRKSITFSVIYRNIYNIYDYDI
ncbi:protein TIC 214-like [Gastrolobium bilobum]|uniref:protein TIC 214-like n=1 Tax=Gastrolobium bilobum TaxID=150636 RepID=UPI002AB09CD2|nr:protein TIC 214-like [Gastrolobium bilobum]